MNDMPPVAAMLRMEDVRLPDGLAALAPSSMILTLDGALPVAHLHPGDTVITRHGACPLARIEKVTMIAGTPIVEVSRNALGGRPERDVWLPATQRILIRDWRAKALYGQPQACVPAGQLTDGEYIRLSQLDHDVTGFALHFGRPKVFYADGLELASADRLTVPA